MEKPTDWIALWRELVEARARGRESAADRGTSTDQWEARARDFNEHVNRRWARPDSSRDFIVSKLDADATVLDIGAGTGVWAALFAGHVRRVTAVDPSPAMIAIMRENLAAQDITTIDIVQGAWPDVAVEPHDYSLCSHAMYGYPDFPAFIRRMIASTKRMCFLLMRATRPNGMMAEAAQHIWGQPHDSPNFMIAYNILLDMGIYPSVLMEDRGWWDAKTSQTLDEALGEMKRHFGLNSIPEYDTFLTTLLDRTLTWQDGRYVWPQEVRSALVYWMVEPASTDGHQVGCSDRSPF